jgi:hypothetical protein
MQRKKKVLQEDFDKSLIADVRAIKSKNSDLGHKNDVQLTMLTQLGDPVNKIGIAFGEPIECEERCWDNKNEEDIECLNTPEHLKYQPKLTKIKAVKLKLKHCHIFEQELEKAMVGCAPKLIHFDNANGKDDKSMDTAVIVARTTGGP